MQLVNRGTYPFPPQFFCTKFSNPSLASFSNVDKLGSCQVQLGGVLLAEMTTL